MGRLSRPPARLAAAPRALGFADRAEANRAHDKVRQASAADTLRHLYSTARWRRLRLDIADRDGWTCRQTGVHLVSGRSDPRALVVDHITPHKGDLALFWDPENLQAVCKEWHDGEKQRQDRAQGAPSPHDPAGGGFHR